MTYYVGIRLNEAETAKFNMLRKEFKRKKASEMLRFLIEEAAEKILIKKSATGLN